MRTILSQQLPLMQAFIVHPHGDELAAMSTLLDELPREVLEAVQRDLVGDRRADTGRRAMTAEQVIRALVVKQLNGFSYAELGFHLADSRCYRTFCRIGALDRAPSRSTLQANIKRLRPPTLAAVNQSLMAHASTNKIETGRTVRFDCTDVETNVHHPSDSRLLWDVVRVLTRLSKRAREYVDIPMTDHTRRAKRRFYKIQNATCQKHRIDPYRDLIKVTKKTLSAARVAVDRLRSSCETGALVDELERVIGLGERVVDQTDRRVLQGEKVPAVEKVLSIFEPHTDLLVKGRKDPTYGHKICLSTGASGLVLDCVILDGNPADVTLATRMVERHKDHHDIAPNQVAFDGAFASRSNLQEIKKLGVEDVSFSKRCGLPITDMVRSSWVYKRLRNFRAGIEGCISFLKRCFGLTRCTWRTLPSFESYVWGSILSANLLLCARHQIADCVT